MKYKRVHCIGIGGIGISSIARHHAAQGAIVSGSDISESELISVLRDEGMTIHIGHKANNIPANVDLIIYTIAIDYENNPEYIEAQKRINLDNNTDISSHHVDILSYPEALGELTKEMKTIAICGTHGKTTTTAMTYAALKQAGMSPTLIVGSLIDHEGKKTNYIKGKTEKNGQHYLVIEACEYKRSFLNYQPEYVLVTNIDEDHLDYYKDIHDIRDAFREFACNINHMGCLIIHKPEEIVFTESIFVKNKKIKSHRLVIADDIISKEDIKLTVIGDHNKSNAQLVVALGHILVKDIYCDKNNSLDKDKEEQFNKNILKGLKDFLGTWRRMEYKGYSTNDAMVYDDYAHHPNEMVPTLTALRQHYPDKKIVLVFQPHLQSRTHAFYEEFIDAMMMVDIVYVLPIYHARSEHDYGLNNYKIVASIIDRHRAEGKEIDECKVYTLDFDNAVEELSKYNNYHVVITMGAGKNNIIADELTKN